jgi:hypothetical protein
MDLNNKAKKNKSIASRPEGTRFTGIKLANGSRHRHETTAFNIRRKAWNALNEMTQNFIEVIDWRNNNYSKTLFSLNSSVMDDNYDTYKTANIEIIQLFS